MLAGIVLGEGLLEGGIIFYLLWLLGLSVGQSSLDPKGKESKTVQSWFLRSSSMPFSVGGGSEI